MDRIRYSVTCPDDEHKMVADTLDELIELKLEHDRVVHNNFVQTRTDVAQFVYGNYEQEIERA